jgi:hypothetical protein
MLGGWTHLPPVHLRLVRGSCRSCLPAGHPLLLPSCPTLLHLHTPSYSLHLDPCSRPSPRLPRGSSSSPTSTLSVSRPPPSTARRRWTYCPHVSCSSCLSTSRRRGAIEVFDWLCHANRIDDETMELMAAKKDSCEANASDRLTCEDNTVTHGI